MPAYNRIKTIVISGSQSNVGKTALAEAVLRRLPQWSALKVTVARNTICPRHSNCGVCSELKKDYEIVRDKKTINQIGKDTARLKKAGARKVVWLKTTSEGLKRGLEKSLKSLRGSKGVVIEGTSVLKHIKPDIAIYIKDNNAVLRNSIEEAEKKADIVIDVLQK